MTQIDSNLREIWETTQMYFKYMFCSHQEFKTVLLMNKNNRVIGSVEQCTNCGVVKTISNNKAELIEKVEGV